ncbi:hypothetical protein [Streptomyces sp. NBC_00826]|uniref:hypothetical protein n=1 Tax=Streptomyces sp. NBC_00826 TaxID=2975845 RepID=UPI002F91933F|nr:hypothetical protein OG832_44640 [Streptomyces sp. NBC_00826]WTB60616.1 hypothetical protein OG832_47265 [Streptomyces sp. NBC_00826]
MPEETASPSPLDQTLAAFAAAYPGLRQTDPYTIGARLGDVRLTLQHTARFAWAGYEVQVIVGDEGHLDRDDPDSTVLYREIRAHATLLVPQTVAVEGIGHIEWEMTNSRAEMAFPASFAVAVADQHDPRFAAAVLSTVGKALAYARLATEHAVAQAGQAADEARWESERPPGISQRTWLRDKRAQRDAAT